MRLLSWAFVGTVAVACGGSAFTPQGDGSGGAGGAGGAAAGGGTSGAGRGGGGSAGRGGTHGGGAQGGGGGGGASGASGKAGMGGSVSAAGEPGVAGSPPDPPDEACPLKVEDLGDGCQGELACSWGDDIRLGCRPSAVCEQGKWLVQSPRCEELSACQGVIVGKECDGAVPSCLLTDSIYCVCTTCPSSGPCGTSAVWACAGGSGVAGCPDAPPNSGTACNLGVPCEYGSCGTDNRMKAVCDGTWSWQMDACPN